VQALELVFLADAQEWGASFELGYDNVACDLTDDIANTDTNDIKLLVTSTQTDASRVW
jgi:hypothetical protein